MATYYEYKCKGCGYTVNATRQEQEVKVAGIERDKQIQLAEAEKERESGIATQEAEKVANIAEAQADAEALRSLYDRGADEDERDGD